MLLELALEFIERDETIERRLEAAVVGLEMPLPEALQRLPLPADLLELLGPTESRKALGELAVHQQIGHALAALAGLDRLLELPLGACHRDAAVKSLIFPQLGARRQRRSQPRPQDQNDDVGGRGGIDDVLEMSRAEHRLVFPKHGRDVEEPGEFALQTADHQGGPATFVADVAR